MSYIILSFLGLTIGSFINVVVYRLPRGRTFIKGRSMCPACGKEIAWYDLIPIASFFALKFRCRRCKQKISWIYPAVEAYSGLIIPLSFWTFKFQTLGHWLFFAVILELLFVLALMDMKSFILPDSVLLAMLAAALLYGILQKFLFKYDLPEIFSVSNLETAFLAFSAFFLVWFFSKGRWMGLGDAKLAGLTGLIFGAVGTLVIIYMAVVAGMLVGLALLAAKRARMDTKLPLGSFIAFSASFYVFLGPAILEKIGGLMRLIYL